MARPHLAPRLALAVSAAAIGVLPRAAHAGGYDTPILYSARHMGMGGTAIGYVNDPSALFHNPAGLGGVRGFEVLGNISPLMGTITTSPGSGQDSPMLPAGSFYPTRTTERGVSPLFLVGAAYRLAEPVTLGLGIYPVAAAAGEYRLGSSSNPAMSLPYIDKTRLVFLEISPGLSVEILKGLYLGAGYRVTMTTLERVKGVEANPQEFNFEVSGVDPTGWRAGLQYRPTDNVSVGLVYRHRIDPELKADRVFAFYNMRDGRTTFTLPSKLGVGVSGKMDRLHGAFDLEYGFYSQNTTSILSAERTDITKTERVTNYFEWQNAITARVGLEYLLGPDSQIPVRVGYIFDGQVGNKMYPTPFGTPPAPSHSVTAGAGYRGEKWQTNVAFAYRYSSTEVTPADVAGATPCASCSKPGADYNLKIMGFYFDVSYRFDVAPIFGGVSSAALVPPAPQTPPSAAPPPDPTPTPVPVPDPVPSPGPAPIPPPIPPPSPTPSP
jgi:long-subunit fatty acid transport protein